jgi:hypothetical protein
MDFDLKNNLTVTYTPLAGYTLPNLFRMLAQNHFHISPRYAARFTYSIALSTIMSPFYLRERLKYDKPIANTAITKDPIFIIGHWRCGTTYLHNILVKDPQFGFFTTYQTLIPSIFISGEKLFKPIVVASLPHKRPMDDADLGADLPQEDIYALGALSPYSYYHGWCFPRNMQHYNDYICMQHASPETIDDWKTTYLHLIKKITMYHNGKQLVLKNQDNTGKIPELLEMFPNAKFIYMYRNPYDLYKSQLKFMTKVIPLYCVQTPPSITEVTTHMMSLYGQMTKKYLQDKHLIPPENLAEVRYETFITQPLETVQSLYKQFHLDGYADIEPAFTTYIGTQKAIHMDQYTFTTAEKNLIANHWGFALKEYEYSHPQEEDIPITTLKKRSKA